MNYFFEGDLRLSAPKHLRVHKFDDPSTHMLSSFMKAVDFIIETDSHTLFVEFKDPENPNAKSKDASEWVGNFKAGKIDGELRYKYRDTWIYQWASGRIKKPIKYLVLIACEALSPPELSSRTSQLKRCIPASGPAGVDWNQIVQDCIVLNISTWNRTFPELRIDRVSDRGK